MKFLKDNIVAILMVFVAVMVTVLIMTIFRKSPKSEEMIRNEVELEYLKKEMPEIKKELADIEEKYDSLLSASQSRVQQLENKKQPIINAIKTIRGTVADFDKEQLRRAMSDY